MTDIYKCAAQNGLRFASSRGALTVEQLFQLPLKSKNGLDLDTVAREIYQELTSISEVSFVEDTSADPKKALLTLALDIVKDVIKTKQEENQAALARSKRAVERKKLLDAIGARKDQQLSAASLEELEKKLSELDS